MSHRTVSAVILSLVAALLTACSAQSVSEQTNSPSPSASGTAPLEVFGRPTAWTTDIGAESWSQPAALGELVVVGANDGVVRALDSMSGHVVWEVSTEGAVRGAIAVDGDVAYVSSDSGHVCAIAVDGTVLWTTALSAPVADRGPYDNYGSRPAVRDGVVYAATQAGMVGALDAHTGTLLWSVDVGAPVETGLALGEARVHVSTMGNRHLALSASDGSTVWEINTLRPATTTPLVMGGTVIVGSRSAVLQVLDEATGEQLWSVTMGGSWVQSGAVALGDDRFAIGSSDFKAVRGFDLETGEDLWIATVVGWAWGVPVEADGVVYASEIRLDYHEPWDAALWAIDAQTGEVLWTASSGVPLEFKPDDYPAYGNGAGPAVVGPMVIVPGLDGVVRAYER